MGQDGAVEADGATVRGDRSKEEVAPGSASGLGGSEVAGVGVDVEDHVGWVVANDCIGVGGWPCNRGKYLPFPLFFSVGADCCDAISLSAHKIVMSTARP